MTGKTLVINILVAVGFCGVGFESVAYRPAQHRRELVAATHDPAAVYTTRGFSARRIVIQPTGGCTGMNAQATLDSSRHSAELVRDGFTSIEYCGATAEVTQ